MTYQNIKIYLIPNLLGDAHFNKVIPFYNIEIIEQLNLFVVENEKSARRFIKLVCPNKSQSDLSIHILNKNTNDEEMIDLINLLNQGLDIGIISEAGLPAVADPGAELIKIAHQKKIKIIPLVGPSSVLMALMASGMNGQNFTFHGYLPIEKNDRKKALIQLEKDSLSVGSAQIFMETPYRNNQMIDDLIKFLSPSTKICVASNITLEDEDIKTLSIADWKNQKYNYHKKPAIFILQS